jgi:hypothetical protein
MKEKEININLDCDLKDLAGSDLLTKKDCVILDKDNNIVYNEDGIPKIIRVATKEPLTAKSICINTLLGAGLEGLNGDDKYGRWELAKKIEMSNGSTSLTTDDIHLLRELVGVAYNPLVVGQLYDIFENKKE